MYSENNRNDKAVRREYEEKFYALLLRVQPKKPDLGVRVLVQKAVDLTQTTSLNFEQACARIYDEARERVERRLKLLQTCPTDRPKLYDTQ